jgi:hypothetical protein
LREQVPDLAALGAQRLAPPLALLAVLDEPDDLVGVADRGGVAEVRFLDRQPVGAVQEQPETVAGPIVIVRLGVGDRERTNEPGFFLFADIPVVFRLHAVEPPQPCLEVRAELLPLRRINHEGFRPGKVLTEQFLDRATL